MIVFEWLIKATIFDIVGKIHVLKLENIGLVAKKKEKICSGVNPIKNLFNLEN